MDAEQRQVWMTREQYDDFNNHLIPSLMRAEMNEMASRLMLLSVQYKWADEPLRELPENVIELHSHSRKVGA